MGGRPALPNRLKRLRGTLRPGRRHAEPAPRIGAPPPRRTLAPDVRAHYKRLVHALRGLRVLGQADGAVLELTAAALAEHDQHVAVVREKGGAYESTTPKGMRIVRPRPELARAADAWRRALTGLVQLGLTPSVRHRVHVLEDEPRTPADPMEMFAARRAQRLKQSPPA